MKNYLMICDWPSTTKKFLTTILVVTLGLVACSDKDEHGVDKVYPIVTSKDAGFQINGKKVTLITIKPERNTASNYMYVISSVPIEAHNSITLPPAGKGSPAIPITNVEIP